MPETIIVIVILALIVGGAAVYIVRSKKKGIHCIGCPHAKTCSKNGCKGCSFDGDKKE